MLVLLKWGFFNDEGVRIPQWYDSYPLTQQSMVRFLPQLKFHLERGESPGLCNSRRRNHEVWLDREEGLG